MRIYTPCLLLALFALALGSPLRADEKSPDAELSAAYEKGVTATAKTSPVVDKLFTHLHACVPSMGQGQVTEAEGKAEAERAEQHKAMKDSTAILEKADGAIKEEVNAQLKRVGPVDISKVDVCQGDSDTFKKMLNDAKEKSKAAAARKIDSIATNLRSKQKDILTKIRAQMQKNSHDRPEDVAGLNKAKGWVFTASSKAACDSAIQMVNSEATNKDLANYEKYLQDLDKKIGAWKDQKNAAVAADIDQKIDQQIAPKLVDRNKCGSQVAQKADKKQEPASEVNKKDKPTTVTANSDKPAVTAPKPAEAPAVAAAKPEVKSEAVTPPKGENTTSDATQNILADTAPKTSEEKAAVAEQPKDLTVTQNGIPEPDTTQLKPITKDDLDPKDTYQAKSDVELKPTQDAPPVQALDDAPLRGNVSGDRTVAQARNDYQNDPIFKNRDLDFNSTKDTRYIQNALNQVRQDQGLPALSTDGVMGSRTTLALDQVMQNPEQKAAFLSALKQQMNGNRKTASR